MTTAAGAVARACDACLARAWLLGRLGGHLEAGRARIAQVLALPAAQLIEAVGGRRKGQLAGELRRLDVAGQRQAARAAGLSTLCRCDPSYPGRLHALGAPPAVLYVAGGLPRLVRLTAGDPVAIVGARGASSYGLEVARALGRDLARAGLTVVSGMAHGIDSAAHAGALDAAPAPGATLAVLPGAADHPYPPRRRALYRRIVDAGVAVSELPPGAGVWRWTFPARNRIIAGLAAMTVVVEAGERSGSLVTAQFAAELRRPVGAVPGPITAPQAAGANALLADGAAVVRGAQDVLDELFGPGARPAAPDLRPALGGDLGRVLAALGRGLDGAAAVRDAGLNAEQGLAALAALELGGYLRRGPGGAFTVLP